MDKSRKAISEAAAEWFVRSRDETFSAEEQEKFARWLTSSPIHVEEYLAVARIWGDLPEVGLDVPIDSSSAASNIIELAESGRFGPSTAKPGKQRPWMNVTRLWGAAAAIVAAIGLGTILVWYASSTSVHHQTGLGEQRSIALEDGSIVEMNTQSEIEVQMRGNIRKIALLRGEAFFEVREDSKRPFVVAAGDAFVRVLGTKFNVYRQASETTITVIEGEVFVASGGGLPDGLSESGSNANLPLPESKNAVSLSKGEQAIVKVDDEIIETISLPSLDRFVAWTDRRLVFENTSLKEILAEFGRYNDINYHISTQQLASLRLTGVFYSYDMDSFVSYLEYRPDVNVSYENGIVIVSADQK